MFNWYQWVTTRAVSHYASHQDGGLFETWNAWEDIWQKHPKSNHPVPSLQVVKIWTGLTQWVSICTEVIKVTNVKSAACLLLQTQAVSIKGSCPKSTCPPEAIMFSVVSKHTEYPLQKGHNNMPTKDLICSTFSLLAWKSARQTLLSLKGAKRKDERCSGPKLAWSLIQRSHERGPGHAHPLPTPWVRNPFPATDAQTTAERKQTLSQTVCRQITPPLQLLSTSVSAWGDQRVTALEDPEPGTKLHPWSFPGRAAPRCCDGLCRLRPEAQNMPHAPHTASHPPWEKRSCFGNPSLEISLTPQLTVAAPNPSWGKAARSPAR